MVCVVLDGCSGRGATGLACDLETADTRTTGCLDSSVRDVGVKLGHPGAAQSKTSALFAVEGAS